MLYNNYIIIAVNSAIRKAESNFEYPAHLPEDQPAHVAADDADAL